jgi:hypothetical protein
LQPIDQLTFMVRLEVHYLPPTLPPSNC